MTIANHRRIVVVGPSASGKTTIARDLSRWLALPHIELDSLYWTPNWRPSPDFGCAVQNVVEGMEWIVDGNYGAVRDLVWKRATAIVWLDYSLPTILRRAVTRSVQRIRSGEGAPGGNRESLLRLAVSLNGPFWWPLRTHLRRRRDYLSALSSNDFSHLAVFRLRSPADISAALATG